MNTTKTYTMGLDLGDRRSTYCLLNANGKAVREDAVATSWKGFAALSSPYPGAGMTARPPDQLRPAS